MAANKALIPMAELVASLSLTDLSRMSGSSADWIIDLVEEGILEPLGSDRRAWRFESSSVTVIRRVQRLQGDLRINLAGVAVVLTLSDENAQLKKRLRQLEGDPAPSVWMPGPE